jgi:hypothetical protein
MKTQFFEVLPKEIRFAMFVDSDMIVGRPLRHLLDDCFEKQSRKPTPCKNILSIFVIVNDTHMHM